MVTINLKIRNIKNIKEANLDLPFENGIYTLVGANGSGKSTIMQCMAYLIYPRFIYKLFERDYHENPEIEFKFENKVNKYFRSGEKWVTACDVRVNGLYEGSLFYGTRFKDSTRIENMIHNKRITQNEIVDADDYVKDQLSYILHGDTNHYRSLKRLKNKHIAEKLGIDNIPYFTEIENDYLISQYKMSSGECLLISLLHFLYNSIERRSLPSNQPVLVLIDELELALHPVAVLRLIGVLKGLADSHSNLIVYLSTHSPEVIRTIPPIDLFKINNEEGVVTLENNCYPSYLIRDLYSNITPDYLLLVEDKLSQLLINKILTNYDLRKAKMVHCVPVGGWRNVMLLHKELTTKKVLGTHTRIHSILDGDVKNDVNGDKDVRNLPHSFLPIPSIEKYLYDIVIKDSNPEFKRLLKDKYFIVKSLDEIRSEYYKAIMGQEKDNNKNFYKHLLRELKENGYSEELFINDLSSDILAKTNVEKFVEGLRKLLDQS